MNVSQFLAERSMSINALSQATGISYSTLHPHVKKGKKVSRETAEKLQEWSSGAMNAVEILGLEPPARPAAPSAPSPAPSEPDSRRRRTPAPTRPAAAKVRRAS